MPRRGRRGYPTAILICLDLRAAYFWTIYSESAKFYKVFQRSYDDEKSLYRFHEELVETIRALLHEGFTGIIVVSEDKIPYSKRFLDHISKRHRWLDNRVTIKALTGKATTASEVTQLIKANQLQETVANATEETGVKLLEQLEKALDEGNILYTIDELNYSINSNKKPVTIMITEEFNQRNQTSRRFQSAIQVSKNIGATVVVLKTTNPISPRLKQLGGFVCVITH
jgi:stalled ribosome rescue protein Dom34